MTSINLKKDYHFTDNFLIATNKLNGTLFEKALILLVKANKKEITGLIINRLTILQISLLTIQMGLCLDFDNCIDKDVLFGGPCNKNSGFIVYKGEAGEITLSCSREILKDFLNQSINKPFLFTLGCSIWSPNQLNQELLDNDWMVAPIDEKIIFDLPCDERWKAANRIIGIKEDFRF